MVGATLAVALVLRSPVLKLTLWGSDPCGRPVLKLTLWGRPLRSPQPPIGGGTTIIPIIAFYQEHLLYSQ
jgi:hypothetical protein